MSKQSTTPTQELPPLVEQEDLKYPSNCHTPWKAIREILGEASEQFAGVLTFYRVKNIGWVITTLHISNPSRKQSAGTQARTYAIGLKDKKIYTVGRGPHVESTTSVYLSEHNIERLKEYLLLHRKGLEEASSIRDRISSRRAQGQIHRAQGKSSWMW